MVEEKYKFITKKTWFWIFNHKDNDNTSTYVQCLYCFRNRKSTLPFQEGLRCIGQRHADRGYVGQVRDHKLILYWRINTIKQSYTDFKGRVNTYVFYFEPALFGLDWAGNRLRRVESSIMLSNGEIGMTSSWGSMRVAPEYWPIPLKSTTR